MRGLPAAGTVGRWAWTPVVLSGLMALVAWLTTFGNGSTQRTGVETLVYVVLVVGLYVFAGNSGILSFGQMSFMAIGAYCGAVLTIRPEQKSFLLDLPHFLEQAELSRVPALLISAALAAVVGGVIGIPLMRLGGIACALSMFAILLIVHVVANNWDAFTRGRSTMIAVPTDTTVWVALLGAIVTVVCAYAFSETGVALRLRAARENEPAAQAVGVNIVRDRWIAFVVSAFFVGMGGFLYGHLQGTFNPDAFYLNVTFLTIAMLVIGGLHSLSGAVIGTLVLQFVSEMLRRVEEGADLGPIHIPGRPGLEQGGVAALLVLTLIFRPKGITGGREIPWPADVAVRWPRRRRGQEEPGLDAPATR